MVLINILFLFKPWFQSYLFDFSLYVSFMSLKLYQKGGTFVEGKSEDFLLQRRNGNIKEKSQTLYSGSNFDRKGDRR